MSCNLLCKQMNGMYKGLKAHVIGPRTSRILKSNMVWTSISLGYLNDLHIFRRGSLRAVRYRDEVLSSSEILYTAAVVLAILKDDNARPHRGSFTTTWRVKGLHIWSDRHTRPTLNPSNIFRFPSAMLWVNVTHSNRVANRSTNKQ